MSLLVVGSVALDNIQTPVASRERVLGGAAVFFSYVGSFFGPVQMLGVVGDDFPPEYIEMLKSRNIDTTGLEIREGGKTFCWTGKYLENMNDRETLDTQLNVLDGFSPVLPEEYRRAEYVFLANASPETQLSVLDQLHGANLVVADTMNLWINIQREQLEALLKRIDGILLNDSEAALLTGETNLIKAARRILEMGPRFVIVKKGEHGAVFISQFEIYLIPAFPTESVVDPTGAGDTFAGGMMGYLASKADSLDGEAIKKAIAYGTIVASFTVEGFGLDRLQEISIEDIDSRLEQFRRMITF